MGTKILFIDDDTSILALYQQLFNTSTSLNFAGQKQSNKKLNSITNEERHKHMVFTASQGEEGIALVKSNLGGEDAVEIAFIDMHMPPGIDGIETAAQIRALAPRMEIVMVTSESEIDLPQLLSRVDRIDKLLYLKKPFSVLEIIQLVNNLSDKISLQKASERFLTNITHELRTPLSSILGFSQILSKDAQNSEHQEMAKIIFRSAEQMSGLINDLIDTALFQEHKVALHKEQVDMNNFLSELISNFQWGESKERVQLKIDAQLPSIQIDPVRFKQAVSQLILNGLKFSPANSLVIVKATMTADKLLSISVTDCGQGIASEYHELIFRRFFRIEDSHHSVEGMGLGLSIAKEIVGLHGGKITLRSEPNKGSCFTITL